MKERKNEGRKEGMNEHLNERPLPWAIPLPYSQVFSTLPIQLATSSLSHLVAELPLSSSSSSSSSPCCLLSRAVEAPSASSSQSRLFAQLLILWAAPSLAFVTSGNKILIVRQPLQCVLHTTTEATLPQKKSVAPEKVFSYEVKHEVKRFRTGLHFPIT